MPHDDMRVSDHGAVRPPLPGLGAGPARGAACHGATKRRLQYEKSRLERSVDEARVVHQELVSGGDSLLVPSNGIYGGTSFL